MPFVDALSLGMKWDEAAMAAFAVSLAVWLFYKMFTSFDDKDLNP